jgi:putative Ca2+/H+ antiporter (TMEM165/GDT1 family)
MNFSFGLGAGVVSDDLDRAQVSETALASDDTNDSSTVVFGIALTRVLVNLSAILFTELCIQ